jgi:hypothetical protein
MDRDGIPILKKIIQIQVLVGNEENGYPVPNPITKEPSDVLKKPLRGNPGRNH